MKTFYAILFVIMVAACSNNGKDDKQSAGRSTHPNPPATGDQADMQNINREPNLIRNQSERAFRTITPDSPQSDTPLTTSLPGDMPRED